MIPLNLSNKKLISLVKNNEDLQKEVLLLTSFLEEDATWSNRLWHIRNNIFNVQKCICGKNLPFMKMDKGYYKSCGNIECKNKIKTRSYKKTCLKKYGVDNTSKLDEVKTKIKNTNFKNSGYECNFKNPKILSDIKKTMKDNYGVEYALQSKKIQNKRKKTMINNYGFDSGLKIAEKNIIKKYGTTNVMQVPEIKEKVSNAIIKKYEKDLIKKLNLSNKKFIKFDRDMWRVFYVCNNCGTESNMHRICLNAYISSSIDICRKCSPLKKIGSKVQKEFMDYIKEIYFDEVLVEYPIENYRLDFFIPKLNLAIEYNGLYWHSEMHKDKNYHKNKSEACEKLGIKLIHVWEDDWINKKNIIKSMISNSFNKSKKIFARKCKILKIDSKLGKNFLDDNHLKGNKKGSFEYIGLFYKNELVSVSSYSYKNNGYELDRLCNKLNCQIIGGSSKMINHFFKNKSGILFSYSDISLNNIKEDSVYEKIGFKYIGKTDPGYSYMVDGMRSHRLNWTKQKLIKMGYDKNKTEKDIMLENKYYRIWDPGNFKWELEIPSIKK